MNNRLIRRSAISVALASVFSASVFADTYTWIGDGTVDDNASSGINWQDVLVDSVLTDVTPVSGDHVLLFNSALAVSPTVFNDLIDLSIHKLDFAAGDFTLSGNTITLQGGTYPNNTTDTNVLSVNTGNVTINNDLTIAVGEIDRILSKEIIDTPVINVNAGSLTLNGSVDASVVNATFNTAAGATLNVNGAMSALSLTATGAGAQNLNNVLTSDAVNIQSSNFNVAGADGAVQATTTGTLTIGQENGAPAALVIDNSVDVNNDRLGDGLAIDLYGGSTLSIIGNDTAAVTEDAGALTFKQANTEFVPNQAPVRSSISTLNLTGNGQSLTVDFDSLAPGASLIDRDMCADSLSRACDTTTTAGVTTNTPQGPSTSRLDLMVTGGTLGSDIQMILGSAPSQSNGLVDRVTLNQREFVKHGAGGALSSATDVTNAFTGSDVLIDAATSISTGVTINSLAVHADINDDGAGGTKTIMIGSGEILSSGTVSIDALVQGTTTFTDVTSLGDLTIERGLYSSAGAGFYTTLRLNGGGSLTLNGTGRQLAVDINDGRLNLGADDAILNASVAVYDELDIGSTTQNINNLRVARHASLMGDGTVNAANDITIYSKSGSVDADLNAGGNVTTYLDNVNGDVSGVNVSLFDVNQLNGSVTASGNVLYDGAGTDSLNGNITASSGRVDVNYANTVNGDITAQDIDLYAVSVTNGDLSASSSIDLSGTVNGTVSGAANVTGYGTLTNTVSHTGTTAGSFTLSGDGAITNSTALSGSYYLNSTNATVDRIRDDAQITLSNGNALSLAGSGSAVSETVGGVVVNSNADAYLNVSNSALGSSTLTADSLSMNAGGLLFISLGDNSKLGFNPANAPATITGSNVIEGVFIEKDIGGFKLPTWATYDASNGVQEVVVNEAAISDASIGAFDFVRVTNATNAALNSNKAIGGLNVDTTQNMAGSGKLTLNSGLLSFWKDNTVSINTIDFGSNIGYISNAGANTVTSDIVGTGGIRKLGDGSLTLAGTVNAGDVKISGGAVTVTGNVQNGDAIVDTGAQLNIAGAGNVSLGSNAGTVNITKSSYSNSGSVGGGGLITVSSNTSFSNTGNLYQTVNNAGSFTNNSSGSVYRLNNTGNASNSGSISDGVDNGSGTFTNNAGGTIHNDYGVTNAGTFTNMASASIDNHYSAITNTGNFTNSGQISRYGSSSSSIVNEAGSTFTNTDNGSIEVTGLTNRGSFSNSGQITVLDGSVSQDGGSFANNNSGSISLQNASLGLFSTGFVNKGSVNIDEDSSVAGNGSYVQTGGTTTVNGVVEAGVTVDLQGGILNGSGWIVGDLIVGPNGTVQPGNSPGTMTIGGDLTIEEGGKLNLEILGLADGEFDRIIVAGAVNIFGKINIALGEGIDETIFSPVDPETPAPFSLADIFRVDGGDAPLDLAQLVGIDIKLKDSLGESFLLNLAADGSVASVQAVPVPAAVWLFGSGLVVLAARGKRRKAA